MQLPHENALEMRSKSFESLADFTKLVGSTKLHNSTDFAFAALNGFDPKQKVVVSRKITTRSLLLRHRVQMSLPRPLGMINYE